MSSDDISRSGPSAPGFDPGHNPWNSPLWGSPTTIGGYWVDASEPTAAPVLEAGPAPRRGRSALVGGIVGAVVLTLLIGAGVLRALPSGSDVSASPAIPSPSAPSAPAASPSDPNADPGAGSGDQIPALPNIPGLPSLPTIPGAGGQGIGGQGNPGGGTAHPQAVAAVAPSLVNITTSVGYDGAEAAGTGVILTSDGLVLTNHHVVAGSTSIRAAVAGTTRTYSATVVGYDASHDIAVIQLRGASGLVPAPIGDSSQVRVGDVVIGLGNAGGAGGAPIPADGSVTGLDRSITAMDSETGSSEDLTGLIETNAPIQPGDSGGALVSADGKIVGINTAGSTGASGLSQGTTDGYAVPINQAMAIAGDIRAGRASATVHIGASAFLGIQVSGAANSSLGVRISGTVPGSAAERVGLAPGDRITAIDGVAVTTNKALRLAIAPHHPGDTVSLTWTDTQGASHTANVTFGSGPVA